MKITGERKQDGIYEIDYDNSKYNFPSVTTILSSLKDPEVDQIRTDVGIEEFAKISSNAAARGSVMHNYLENYALALMKYKDKEKSLLYTQKKTFDNFKELDSKLFEKGRNLFYNVYHSDFKNEFHKPLMIEGLMVSFKYKYAGRTDCIYCNESNEIILGDYKTCSKVLSYQSNKVIKYKLQLAAYINAFEELYQKNISAGVIWVSSNYECQKFVLSKFEYPIYLNYFLKLVEQYSQIN